MKVTLIHKKSIDPNKDTFFGYTAQELKELYPDTEFNHAIVDKKTKTTLMIVDELS